MWVYALVMAVNPISTFFLTKPSESLKVIMLTLRISLIIYTQWRNYIEAATSDEILLVGAWLK